MTPLPILPTRPTGRRTSAVTVVTPFASSPLSTAISSVERAARALKLWRDSDDDDDEKRQRAAWLALEALSLSGIAQLPVTGLRRALQSALITGEYGWVKGLQHIIGWRPKLEE